METIDQAIDPRRELVPVVRMRRRRRNRRRLLAAGVVLISVIAAATWALTRPERLDDRLLVVDEDGAVSLIDPGTGASLFEVPGATPTPDRSALLTTESGGGSTVLSSRDPVTGAVTGSTRLKGELTIRTVSPRGEAVALMPGPKGEGLYQAGSRERTSLTVSYLDSRGPRTYDLPGNIEPEMFSYDEGALFVLQFEPPLDPTSYLVRRLDLATGEVTDTESPQVELNPRMRATARAQVLHPDGTYLYTLYTVPNDGQPVYGGETDDEAPRYAFVHIINLEEEWSYCLFLPTPIGTIDEAAVGLGVSPDGTQLVVADAGSATVARIDTEELTVTGTSRIDALSQDQSKAVVSLADDSTLYLSAAGQLLEIDLGTLSVGFAWEVQGTVTGLGVSATGDQLRVAHDGVITLIDRSTRREVGVLDVPGDGSVTLLGPPRGSVTEFPLDCAC
jgi:DNA-binding beta-propeller fold protein YncE